MSGVTYVSRSETLTDRIAFLQLVGPDLSAIEDRLNVEITSSVRTINSLSGYVLTAGGKRLRPAVVTLAARTICDSPPMDRLITVAASVELVHMATLVHDDVVDDTATRRGQPTANAVFGNGVSVLTGDFLLAKAMRLLAVDGDLRIIRTVSDITTEMSEGEVLEILATGDPEISLETYYEILHKKTAAFVAGCCRCGAILGEADDEANNGLTTYGHRLGMAFQIADDLLDYTGDPELTGKPVGSDLRDGRATLPFLLALESASATERKQLLRWFAVEDMSESAMNEIVAILHAKGALERTRQIAQQYIEEANRALGKLPPSPARDCFFALTQYVIERDR